MRKGEAAERKAQRRPDMKATTETKTDTGRSLERLVRWRMLKVGEYIRRTDQWWDERDATWNPTTADSWALIVTKDYKVRRAI